MELSDEPSVLEMRILLLLLLLLCCHLAMDAVPLSRGLMPRSILNFYARLFCFIDRFATALKMAIFYRLL